MKSLTASLIKIAHIIKKNVDIVEKNGLVSYSSDLLRCGIIIDDFDCKNASSIGNKLRFYIHIENGSCVEVSLVQLILMDKISEGTADNYQQFLINILEGFEESAENSKKFNIPYDGQYVVYCIRLLNNEQYSNAYSLIYNSFYEEEKVWIIPYGKDLILIELMCSTLDKSEINNKIDPKTVRDMVNSEIYEDIYIGIGNIHKGILNIKKSVEEAETAIKVGKLFNLPENIFSYNKLLPEIIINLLSKEKASQLCSEIFCEAMDGIQGGEMIKTVGVFFKNNLNISDSSKILYIHRNTLLYRLDKIQKLVGLDIRKFEDAVTFKLLYLIMSNEKRKCT